MPSISPPIAAPFRSKSKSLHPRPCLVQYLIRLCSKGHLTHAIECLHRLIPCGIRLNSQTVAFLLEQCAKTKSLREGKWIHLHLKLTGMKNPNTFISNNLINMYFSCGDYRDARLVFSKMLVRNVYSWNYMLGGYAKLGMVKQARKVFDKMRERDVVSWNTMVLAHAQSGNCAEALMFYRKFRRLNTAFNEFSFAGILLVCAKLSNSVLSRQVHCQILVAGYLDNMVISSSVVVAYSNCGEMGDARRVFEEMPLKDVLAWTILISGYAKQGDMKSAGDLFDDMPEKNSVSWTSMVSGYARCNEGKIALAFLRKMVSLSVRPNQFTLSSSLCACANLASLDHGKQIHAFLLRTIFRPNTILVSSLIDMYSKCNSLEVAQKVFYLVGSKQDAILWNTMLSALAYYGCGEEAICLFHDMVISGIKPDRVSFIAVLNACSQTGRTEEGLRFFKSMTNDFGIGPDQDHYACLANLLGRDGLIEK